MSSSLAVIINVHFWKLEMRKESIILEILLICTIKHNFIPEVNAGRKGLFLLHKNMISILHFLYFLLGFNSCQYQLLPLLFPECRTMMEDDREWHSLIKREKNSKQEDKHHSCLCLASSFLTDGADSSFPLGVSWGLQTDANMLITLRANLLHR